MAALTWRWTVPSDQTITSATYANDLLAAINAVVTANSGAADAIWEVATYQSTSPRYVLLRRKQGSPNPPGRIIFFGQNGSTANANAIYPGASGTNMVMIGYSPSSTSDTQDQSYLSGAPLTATDYLRAVPFNVNTGATSESYRCYYGEHDSGFVFIVLRKQKAIAPSIGAFFGAAGELFVDTNGTFLPALISSGNSQVSTWTAATSLAYVDGGISGSYSSSNPALIVLKDGVLFTGFRMFSPVAAANENALLLDSDSTVNFMPIPIILNPLRTGRTAITGRLRQIAYGPQALQETFLHDAATDVVTAHALCPAIAAVGDAMWFVNVEV